ncbi:hypothetical protein [Goodfellowiella coeruleoviolacea]|uniref:Uncharacterized protein n=1 Tax=Goodfellowiella coeruleoviolacea TaxID=334858 RepID=A0AAE3KE48_9PSEU|nr:hypothetical protein [Goodfellowiella coeruleoviolacea]MCP2163537.1 hypothetical protein [Goodfellowiella coeruleoviolacea]
MEPTVYDGLKRYGFDAEAAEVAARSTGMWLDTWDRESWFPEYFDPEPDQSINASATDTAWRTYSWSNLMPLMRTHELIADEPWSASSGIRFGTLGLPGTNTVHDVWLRGHRYGVSAGPRLTRLVQDGRVVFEARGARVVVRDFVLTDTGASFRVTAQGPVRVSVWPRTHGGPRQVETAAGSTTVHL